MKYKLIVKIYLFTADGQISFKCQDIGNVEISYVLSKSEVCYLF